MLFAATVAGPAAAEDYGARGSWRVETVYGEWRDEVRDRTVPYKLYLPAGAPGARPVIVHSHGLGGSREAGGYLNEHAASRGFVVFAVQHPGTDESVIDRRSGAMTSLTAAMRDPQAAADRFRDIAFVLDRISEMNRGDAYAGRFDMERVGMSGHSYGAVSTLVAAGQRIGAGLSFKEPRIRAAIAYSPNKPRRGDPATMLRDVDIPMLHMTGTEDRSPVDPAVTPEDRTIPFEVIDGADQVLVVIAGAKHALFGGRDGGGSPGDAGRRAIAMQASAAFWSAYLEDDVEARRWLLDGGLGASVGDAAEVRIKRAR
jgi:predicted dienelactone hydrolase